MKKKKKGIFGQAWAEAMSKHEKYKEEKLLEIKEIKLEMKDKTVGFFGVFGVYYLRKLEDFLKRKK